MSQWMPRGVQRGSVRTRYILFIVEREKNLRREEEIEHALEEGIIFHELINPIRIIGNEDGWVTGIELVRMKLGEMDNSGRPRPVPIIGSEVVMELDTVIEAIGTQPNRLFLNKALELETTRWDTIKVDDHLMTNIEGVYAGGDAIRGTATVILALGDGRKAAKSINQYLSKRS